ncbi:hypothetical protein KSS87_022092, partial [Heliosperma pusillum]
FIPHNTTPPSPHLVIHPTLPNHLPRRHSGDHHQHLFPRHSSSIGMDICDFPLVCYWGE